MPDGPHARVLDGNCTSLDWHKGRPRICVLPVGAFEQHSRHLPLASDNIAADYFGRFLAEELGAALLPTLNYGTSLEQTGFAGTISLRPETLMQVLRDIAEAVTGQGFATMVIMNIHGGNIALGPVVRDINRRNGPLKIILTDIASHFDRSLIETCREGGLDMHSGEAETSLMLVIAPGLVKDDRRDIVQQVQGFEQTDLNTFGMGFNAPDGAYGRPSLATREKGERLLAKVKLNLVKHVKERLAWLDKSRTYSGKGQSAQ